MAAGRIFLVAATFAFVWLWSLFHTSDAATAYGIETAEAAAGHLLYTSDSGPPDGAAVPVLSMHPVHGAEVRGWRSQNGSGVT